MTPYGHFALAKTTNCVPWTLVNIQMHHERKVWSIESRSIKATCILVCVGFVRISLYSTGPVTMLRNQWLLTTNMNASKNVPMSVSHWTSIVSK